MSRSRRRRSKSKPASRVLRILNPVRIPIYIRKPRSAPKAFARKFVPFKRTARAVIKATTHARKNVDRRLRSQPRQLPFDVIDVHDDLKRRSLVQPARTFRCVQRPNSRKAAQTPKGSGGGATWKPWCQKRT